MSQSKGEKIIECSNNVSILRFKIFTLNILKYKTNQKYIESLECSFKGYIFKICLRLLLSAGLKFNPLFIPNFQYANVSFKLAELTLINDFQSSHFMWPSMSQEYTTIHSEIQGKKCYQNKRLYCRVDRCVKVIIEGDR